MQIQKHVRLSRTFLQIALQLTQDPEAEHVLSSILEQTMDLTGADRGTVITESSIGRTIRRGARSEEPLVLQQDPYASVLQRGEIVVLSGQRSPSEGPLLGVPIVTGSSVLGAIFLERPADGPDFDDDDCDLLEAAAALGAVAIENFRALRTERKRAEFTESIRRVAGKVKTSLDAEEVLGTTVEELGRVASVHRCHIRLIESPGSSGLGPIEHEWTAEGIEPLAGEQEIQHPVGSLAAATRKSQWTDDVDSDPRFGGSSGRGLSLEEQGVRAVLAAPLEWADELLGVIVFQSCEPRRWSVEDRTLIEEAGREVAIAVQHARMYEEALDTVEELRELEQRRAEYISMVSHEIRSPMTVVAGIADILKKKRHRLPDDSVGELIASLEREATRLARLVSEVLDLERMDRGGMPLSLAIVDLVELVQEAVEDTGEGKRITFSCDCDAFVARLDKDKIKQVLINLLSNAVKFGGEDIAISVDVRTKDDRATISVTDRGPGIAPQDQERLFKRFSRLQPTVVKPGSGLGLYLSRLIVERHGGKIWVTSKLGEGTTFSFTLPADPPEDGTP